jgi:hypothetical protein
LEVRFHLLTRLVDQETNGQQSDEHNNRSNWLSY